MDISHNVNKITAEIDALNNRYNPEMDIIPDTPVVTWADFQNGYISKCLLDLCLRQQLELDRQNIELQRKQDQIDGLVSVVEKVSQILHNHEENIRSLIPAVMLTTLKEEK